MPSRRSQLTLLMTLALLASISLQPVSVAVASMLGQRHLHREVPSAQIWLGLVGNWRGSSHAGHDDLVSDVRHAQAHALGLRHHHDIDDSSVVPLEPLASADSSPADVSVLSVPLVFQEERELKLPPASAVAQADWSRLELRPTANPHPRRIERPPSLVV